MKMVLTPATTPDGYIACLTGWQRTYAEALRGAVRISVPQLEERLKWAHLVYFKTGPVLIIRAEPERVLWAFMRGQRLRHIEPRLKPGGNTSWPRSSCARTRCCAGRPWFSWPLKPRS